MSIVPYKPSAVEKSVAHKRARLQGLPDRDRPVTHEPEAFHTFELWQHPEALEAIIVRCAQLEKDTFTQDFTQDSGSSDSLRTELGEIAKAIHTVYELSGDSFGFSWTMPDVYNFLVDNANAHGNPIKAWNPVCVAFNEGKVSDDFDRTLEPYHKTRKQYCQIDTKVELALIRLKHQLSRREVELYIPCAEKYQRESGHGSANHGRHHGPCVDQLEINASMDSALFLESRRNSASSLDPMNFMSTLAAGRLIAGSAAERLMEASVAGRLIAAGEGDDYFKASAKQTYGHESLSRPKEGKSTSHRPEYGRGHKSRDHKESSTHHGSSTRHHRAPSTNHASSSTHHTPSNRRHHVSSIHRTPSSQHASSSTRAPSSSRHESSRTHASTLDKSMSHLSVKDDGHKSHRHRKPGSTNLAQIAEDDDGKPRRKESHKDHGRSGP